MMKRGAIRIMAGALALAAFALPGGAAAQAGANSSKQFEQSASYPLAGMSEAEMAEFFAAMSASEEVGELIEPLLEELLAPAKAVPGWQSTGIDLLAELGARPGGLAGNLLHDPDAEVATVTDLSGTAMPDLAGFQTLVVRPAGPGANERTFASFLPGIWLALNFQRTTQGNSMCYSGAIGLTIHSRTPIDSLDEDTVFAAAALVATFDRVTERTFCTVYSRSGTGYVSLAYRPDGRRLPGLDGSNVPLQIMKSADLGAFMRTAVPTLLEE